MVRKTLHESGSNFALERYLDVITDANFGNDQLSGFSMAKGPILGFRRRPYNTLTLPCECMIFESLTSTKLCSTNYQSIFVIATDYQQSLIIV